MKWNTEKKVIFLPVWLSWIFIFWSVFAMEYLSRGSLGQYIVWVHFASGAFQAYLFVGSGFRFFKYCNRTEAIEQLEAIRRVVNAIPAPAAVRAPIPLTAKGLDRSLIGLSDNTFDRESVEN